MTRITVPFKADPPDGEAVEELSWGQREIWTAMVRQEWWLPIGYARAVPPGTTVEDLADEVRYMMSRYPTLRTTLRYDPDGRTRQVVAGAGEIEVELVDAADDEDPERVADQVRQRYWDGDYDLVHGWPIWVAVIRHRGAPTHLVTVMSHLVLDAFGGIVMLEEVAARPAEPTAMPPAEQVRWQASPAGQRQNAAALRYWEKVLRAVPARRFPHRHEPRAPRHWEGRFRSPAAHLALRVLAARTKVDASPLLLATFAIAMARHTGINPVVVQVVVNNRFRPGLARSMSPLSQTGVCAIDLAGLSVDDAVRLTARQAIAAYKHAYYNPSDVDDLVARLARERGEELDLACFFNDRRIEVRTQAPTPPPAPSEVYAALPRSTFEWTRRRDTSFERMFAHIEDVPDAMAITVAGDTHYMSPDDLEAVVRGMEAVAVEAALDPAATTGVHRS
ncbi:condensation domain-containing protein [Phytohabitans sp. ZYX-F-186]|uniref:Condensation domain-containing protein n=1 Tax=Phytohabitans maris TaxID=3071409 RepID=A0ABU0ZV93_9ACTN|nr:condensation domain-containing protein [Phytohabitans sp. ZYX-F-186]MDQ7910870.1 condensation domain-containing protein [Phytohabitans sp. ZYX-F-186]